MTQEQRDLLVKDLSMRLPYGVKVQYENEIFDVEYVCPMYDEIKLDNHETWTLDIEEVKPYLFPLSSMSEEQKKELREMEWSFDNSTICNIIECFGTYRAYVDHSCCFELVEWCIKNKFDYRGLIPMGLAEDATGKNIY